MKQIYKKLLAAALGVSMLLSMVHSQMLSALVHTSAKK